MTPHLEDSLSFSWRQCVTFGDIKASQDRRMIKCGGNLDHLLILTLGIHSMVPGSSDGKKKKKKKKKLPAMQKTLDSPGQEDSPGEGNGNPLQYSCLENLKDRGARWQDSRASTTITGVFCVLFSPEGLSFSINISENEELLKNYPPLLGTLAAGHWFRECLSPLSPRWGFLKRIFREDDAMLPL